METGGMSYTKFTLEKSHLNPSITAGLFTVYGGLPTLPCQMMSGERRIRHVEFQC